VCSLDGAGWVAGIRKDLPPEDDYEKNDVLLEENYENMVGKDVSLCQIVYLFN